jgi:hypothetical protein
MLLSTSDDDADFRRPSNATTVSTLEEAMSSTLELPGSPVYCRGPRLLPQQYDAAAGCSGDRRTSWK